MATVTTDGDSFSSVGGAVMFYFKTFGPSAFGVVTLLLIWQFIVAPQMQASKMNFDKVEAIIDKQRENSEKMLEVSRTLERTANTMQATTTKLEAIVENVARTQ